MRAWSPSPFRTGLFVVVVAAQLVDFTHDRLERGFVGVGAVLPAGRQLAARQQLLERDPAARDPALDRADRAAADFRRFLVGEAAGTDEDQRLALWLRQMHQRALHV